MTKMHLLFTFLLGAVVSGIAWRFLSGCRHLFQTGPFMLMASFWPKTLAAFFPAAGIFVNAFFHGLSLVFLAWVGSTFSFACWPKSVLAKWFIVGACFVFYLALLFILFPVKECGLP
jgi:hypothetical protein